MKISWPKISGVSVFCILLQNNEKRMKRMKTEKTTVGHQHNTTQQLYLCPNRSYEGNDNINDFWLLWIYILLLLKKIGKARPGEGDWQPISLKTPAPHYQPIEKKKIRENSWRQKRREQLGQQKGIGPALETRQSHTIKYGVNQIVPERYWEKNKSPAVLLGSAVGKRKNIPMCDQSTACNPDWHIRRHKVGASGYTWSCTAYTTLPQIDDGKDHS